MHRHPSPPSALLLAAIAVGMLGCAAANAPHTQPTASPPPDALALLQIEEAGTWKGAVVPLSMPMAARRGPQQAPPTPGCEAIPRPDVGDALARRDTVRYGPYTVAPARVEANAADAEGGRRVVLLTRGEDVLKRFNGGLLPERGGPMAGWWRTGLFSFLGELHPELVVVKFSGGANCCWTTWIYRLAPEVHQLFFSGRYAESERFVAAEDLDGDGVCELTQPIDRFDGIAGLSHADSPFPLAVFRYRPPADRYVPANGEYPDRVLGDVKSRVTDLRELKQRSSADNPRSRVAIRAEILSLLLDYIYAGRADAGWDFFEQEFEFEDQSDVRVEIEERLRGPVYEAIYSGRGK